MDFEKSKCSDNRGVQKIAVETHIQDVMRHQSHKDMYWQVQCATTILSQQSAFKHHEDGMAGLTFEATAVSYGGEGQLQPTSCAKNARIAHINNDNYN